MSSQIRLKDRVAGEEIDLSDLTSQVHAIARIHDKVYQPSDVTDIQFRGYLTDLLRNTFSLFCNGFVKLTTYMEEIELPTKTVTNLVLVINELALYAMKQGFVGEGPHQFVVTMKQIDGSSSFRLKVSNIGATIPEDVNLKRPQSVGMQLLQAICEQIDGELTIQRKPSPEFVIVFPVEE